MAVIPRHVDVSAMGLVQCLNPSIDFLELYTLVARVVAWAPHLTNKIVHFHSDNTPIMHALINKTSDNNQMLLLLGYLTLFCMIHNIEIKASHSSGKNNIISDLLCRFKLQEFH